MEFEYYTDEIVLNNSNINNKDSLALNNFIQIVSKCKGIMVPKNISKFKVEGYSDEENMWQKIKV